MDISIICITYNHVNYINTCIESLLMQKTKYSFEIIIHDDASNDGTTEIIKSYQKKYPNLIFPIFQKNNQFSQGINIFKKYIFPNVRGNYVALCEGDDYWTDPYKLQKQASTLESHPDVYICFHPVTVHWDNNIFADTEFPKPNYRFNKNILNLSDLLKHNFIQTNSVMYRWIFKNSSFDIFPNDILPCDWFLHLLHARAGSIFFINENMSVYRRHENSIWYECMETPQWYKKCGIQHYHFYEEVEKNFNRNFSKEKEKLLACSCLYSLVMHDNEWFNKLKPYISVNINKKYLLWMFLLRKGLIKAIYGLTKHLIKKSLSFITKKIRECHIPVSTPPMR